MYLCRPVGRGWKGGPGPPQLLAKIVQKVWSGPPPTFEGRAPPTLKSYLQACYVLYKRPFELRETITENENPLKIRRRLLGGPLTIPTGI